MPPTHTGSTPAKRTFHLFPRLPWELRAMIWEATIRPREVDVRVVSRRIQTKLRIQLLSVSLVPAILQVCKQSRYLGLYKQAFAEIPLRTHHSQRRYVWVNWDYDTISVGGSDLYHFRYKSIQTCIQRLNISRSLLHPGEIQDLQDFLKLKKLYILADDSFKFRWVFRNNPLPCGQKNIFLHDTKEHTIWNSFDLDKFWDENGDETNIQGVMDLWLGAFYESTFALGI